MVDHQLAAVTDEAYIALWRILLHMDLMDTVTVHEAFRAACCRIC